MHLRTFTESAHCRSGRHCWTCRDTAGGGPAFRRSLAKAFALPDDGPDFACPHGRPWGHVPPEVAEAIKPPPAEGPGTELRKLLDTIGIRDVPGCQCKLHADEMNRRGADWCEANVDKIVGWMRAEAERQGLPFVNLAGRTIVKAAIKRARKPAAAEPAA